MRNIPRKTLGAQPEKWYDTDHDCDLIAQSIAKQYGILPSEQEELSYGEWAVLVGGIMEDTPLGQVVLIRMENDRDRLKNFTAYEHRIRTEWQRFLANEKLSEVQDAKDFAADFERMLAAMFG